MSIEDDGGAAFPSQTERGESGEYWVEHLSGMSLRDYFAAKAIAAFIANAPSGTSFGTNHPETNANYAKAAYVMADALLEARKQ